MALGYLDCIIESPSKTSKNEKGMKVEILERISSHQHSVHHRFDLDKKIQRGIKIVHETHSHIQDLDMLIAECDSQIAYSNRVGMQSRDQDEAGVVEESLDEGGPHEE